MYIKQIKLTTLIAGVIIILCSFKGDVKPFERTDWIPDDFDGSKGVLLVQNAAFNVSDKQNEKLTGQMREMMQKFYPYKYEFALGSEIFLNKKFPDKDKYRWALGNGNEEVLSGGMAYSSCDFYIYDRLNKKYYPYTRYSTSFVKTVMSGTLVTLVHFTKNKAAAK